MFTGIIEETGIIIDLENEKENLHITTKSTLSSELKIDQSLAHNGVCLTVVAVNDESHTVTAIKETLAKTNVGRLCLGDTVNLERAMKLGDRLDGHLVQGHVDATGVCTNVEEQEGSWLFTFRYDTSKGNITIEKGSITVDGTSLTVVNSYDDSFSVAIIPYTYQHTNFKNYRPGSVVNLEFDMIGKYVAKLVTNRK